MTRKLQCNCLIPLVAGLSLLAGGASASELADLVQNGERRAALALIDSGADVNEAQGDGTTPLHWAVYRVDHELTAILLERGADTDVINAYGASPLGEAVKVAERDLTEMLLAAGADAEAPNTDGQTALMLASRSGSIDIARLLIEHGADVNSRESWRGQSALIWAADSVSPEIVDLLIEHGAEVDFRANAFDWPSQITSEPRAQYRPVGGLTPLLYAARAGCTPCVRSIVAAGAAIDRPTPEGMTPLIIAIDNGAFDTAKLLLEQGANPHLWDWYGRTALYVAVDMANAGRGTRTAGGAGGERPVTGFEIIELLLAADVDPNAQLNMHRPGRGGNIGRFSDPLLTTGATPMLRAAISHDIQTMQLLLAHGAHADRPNVQGVTPLIAAAWVGTSARNQGAFLGRTAEQSAIETIQLLLDAGADVNARTDQNYDLSAKVGRCGSMTETDGQTALFGAMRRSWTDVSEFLIANGADVDIVDTLGRSPVDYAMARICDRDSNVSEETEAILRLLVETGQ
jgi:ankyrin repeat protein